MTLLTATECREKAYRKMAEANYDRQLGLKLRSTAEAWLALADQIERADVLGTFAKRTPGGDDPSGNNKPL
jgi:hypothetical protein